MTAITNFVYCKCFCVPKPGSPKAFTGLYYAKRGATGIWYWVRSLEHAHRFVLSSHDACQASSNLGNVGTDELVGFVRESQ